MYLPASPLERLRGVYDAALPGDATHSPEARLVELLASGDAAGLRRLDQALQDADVGEFLRATPITAESAMRDDDDEPLHFSAAELHAGEAYLGAMLAQAGVAPEAWVGDAPIDLGHVIDVQVAPHSMQGHATVTLRVDVPPSGVDAWTRIERFELRTDPTDDGAPTIELRPRLADES